MPSKQAVEGLKRVRPEVFQLKMPIQLLENKLKHIESFILKYNNVIIHLSYRFCKSGR